MADQLVTRTPVTIPRAFWGYVVDVVSPMAAYFLLHSLGVADFWGLIAGSLIALTSTVLNSFRRKGLDRVGVLVLVEIAASIGFLFLSGDPRLLLIKPSFYTAIGGMYVIFTSLRGKPLNYEPVKALGSERDGLRATAFDGAWRESAEFRFALRMGALGWGAAFLADAVLRVIIVYRVPVQRAAWLSNLPHITAIVLLIGFSALLGRKTKRLVDEQVQRDRRTIIECHPTAEAMHVGRSC